MSKLVFLIVFAAIFMGAAAASSSAQTPRKSVSGSEVTGTFRYTFAKKFKGSSSDIKILALGGGKIKVGFELIFPHIDAHGDLTANLGEAVGIADISGDTAVFRQSTYGKCTITIKFVKPGEINVDQNAIDSDCGFGHNVTADGTYRKVSSRKPKFGD